MNKVSKLYPKKDIQEQACLWISRIDRGLTNTEKHDLFTWNKKSKAHHDILLEMASYWDDLSVLNELSALFPLEQTHQRSAWVNLAMAASFVIVSLLSITFFINDSLLPFSHSPTTTVNKTFKTNIGEQNHFSMPDGTNIQLNTNSIVNIAFSKNHRQLTLVQGEARFDVAKDKTRPFTVTAGTQSFTALGTIFNVQKNNNINSELVVTEGRVLITKASESLSKITSALSNLPKNKLPGTLVVSGEKTSIVNNIQQAVTKISLDQIQRDLAWQQGMLIFDGQPLAQALIEVSRYTKKSFQLSTQELSNIKVSGYFKAGDIDGLLASLHSNFNITATELNNNVLVLTAAK